MRQDTRRTLLIVAGVVVLLAAAGIGSAVWLFVRSIETTTADADAAARQFDRIRADFAGVVPVLAVGEDEAVVARHPPAGGAVARPSAMHILAWDPGDDTLVRIDLPFWFLRLKSGPIALSSNRSWMGGRDLGLTVEDLERYGPTLVLDHERHGGRVLVWTE